MAWSFSHSQEAYDNLRANLQTLPVSELREIYACWVAFEVDIAIAILQDPEFHRFPVCPSHYLNNDIYNWIKDDYHTTYQDRSIYTDTYNGYQSSVVSIQGIKVSDTQHYNDLTPNTVDLNDQQSLITAIWPRVMSSDYGCTSDNGGFNVYLDPYGYNLMSFDLVDGAELED